MKQFIDFQATLQAELAAKNRLASKMRHHWGVEMRDGVEVYKDSFTIWPGTESDSVRKVLKLFGIPIKDIQNQSKDGLSRLYLKLVPGKIDTSSYSKEALATELETLIPMNEYRTFRLSYTDMKDSMKFLGWTKEQIRDYVVVNKVAVSKTSVVSTNLTELNETNIDDVMGAYIMAEDGTDFQKELVDVAVVAVPVTAISVDTETGMQSQTTEFGTGITLEYRYKRTGYLDDNSPIVVDVYGDMTAAVTDSESNQRVSGIRSLIGTRLGQTDALWYDGRIRTEAAKLLKKHDYANLIMGSLDSGYDQQKNGSSLLGLLVVIVVVVLVNMAVPGAGFAAIGAATTTAAALTAIAITATVITLALVAAQYLLARSGENVTAEYIGRWVKVTGAVAMVAGIMAAINALIVESAKQAALEGAKTAAIDSAEATAMSTAVDVGNGMVVDMANVSMSNVYDAGVKLVAGSWENSSWLSKMSTASKVVNPVMEWRQKNLQKELTSMSDECKKQQAALAEEYDKNLHIGIEDIKMSTKPLNAANIQFEVDYLYEPTKFNICRTSFVRSGMNIIS